MARKNVEDHVKMLSSNLQKTQVTLLTNYRYWCQTATDTGGILSWGAKQAQPDDDDDDDDNDDDDGVDDDDDDCSFDFNASSIYTNCQNEEVKAFI